MIILTTDANQSIKFIPRDFGNNIILKLTNKNTRFSFVVGVSAASSNGYMTITGSTFALVENNTYSMTVFLTSVQDSKVIYRDMIFCTDQTISDYSINKNVYTEHQSSNEYIFYNE
jgi:hypothetical protein